MELTDFLLHTDRVPILDYMGVQIDEVALPEATTPVPRRRCGISEDHIYYKGAGIIYQGHYANEPDEYMIRLSENPVAYQRYSVVYPGLYQKYGIFTFCHQPVFTDYEGGCGPKERNLLTMQEVCTRESGRYASDGTHTGTNRCAVGDPQADCHGKTGDEDAWHCLAVRYPVVSHSTSLLRQAVFRSITKYIKYVIRTIASFN